MSRHFVWFLILTLFVFPAIVAADNSEGFRGEGKSLQRPFEKETGKPQKPAGGILLGGDCSDYVDLSGQPLPIEVSGSTVGATNDYGPFPSFPECWRGPWSAQSCAAPDVTYKWTAPADGAYTISLCGSGYNTGLEIYDFTCPDEPVYPDNFICGNEDNCALQSELPCFLLVGGQEILIVVDGYENNTGEYQLAIFQCERPPNDDCSNYVDLTGEPLPIFVSGTTLGAANDYGPFPSTPNCWQGVWVARSCAGTDVTYKWTAPASGYYTLEVCNSDYDSAILLYNFTCPDEPIYPDDFICGNDDFCAPNYPYAAGLQSIFLEENQEVLVVVDGYRRANSGNFDLVIYGGVPPPPPFECPENTIFSQPASTPLDPFMSWASDIHLLWKVYDNLPDLSGAICQISFWGFDWYWSDGWQECEEDPMTFEIRFYEDDDGYPGTLVCSRSFTPTRTPTGVIYYSDRELNYYEGVLDPCCEVDGGWISIYGTSYAGDPENCTFLWLDSQEGDDLCYQWNGSWFFVQETSMSLCLAGDCNYMAGDCNHNGIPLELADVITMVGMYRGSMSPDYTCSCPPHGDEFAPEGDPNGNCIAFELGDVVTEIAAYRGTDSASGCEDCPGSLRLSPGGGDQPPVLPTLKSRIKISRGSIRD